MPQSLSSLLIHLIFSTKDRYPFLGQKDLLSRTHAYLGGILRDSGSPSITIGGTADHVHAFFRLSRTQQMSKLVETLKSHSSRWLKCQGIGRFAWQRGYGCFSVSQSQAATLAQYIENQAEHHRRVSFQEEFREILRRYEIAFDERYVWD
jgi:putative transposase